MLKQIVFAGPVGTGKSSTAKLMALHMNTLHRNDKPWVIHSASAIFRQMAQKHFTDLDTDSAATAFASYTKEHPEMDVDGLIDRELIRVGKEETNVIIECRMACFLPNAFRVNFFADDELIVQRVAAERGLTLEAAKEKITLRNTEDLARYSKLYPWVKSFRDQFENPGQGWHLEINSGIWSHDEVVERVYKSWSDWEKGF
jgi:cytidylate kinase